MADLLELLLLVIGCYAAAALLVHLAFWFGRERKSERKHYVLIADGRQHHMEWYLRSLHSFSRWMGKEIQLTVVDRGLTEESKAIVDRWNRSGKVVRLHQTDGTEQADQQDGKRYPNGGDRAVHLMWLLQAEGIVSEADHAVLVDLQNPEDLSKMPF
ncbi:hypothetical protein RB620_24065 [Paenibacillus sp. LHD-117]|uniref:hypothetical protein n=1 Tax=Paenibacillus sp. LHD-117 TaxID=3071412 RepID=UPI0027DF29D5|nr:hypothetical protein [Paenibacillus sp. LHD-117]MDQ6422512.1 hypothetical protein [Paenibacillus sp. LHD-117]